jgi:hypothetical protein
MNISDTDTNSVSIDMHSHVATLLTIMLHLLERLYVDSVGRVCF